MGSDTSCNFVREEVGVVTTVAGGITGESGKWWRDGCLWWFARALVTSEMPIAAGGMLAITVSTARRRVLSSVTWLLQD